MKKAAKSPLEQQADKRFLNQITGLDLDEDAKGGALSGSHLTGLKRLIAKVKKIL